MLKPVQAITCLFVLSVSSAFGNEICDPDDLEWNILTNSGPIPASSHLLIDNGQIIRRDLLEKQQLPAYKYLPAWQAYKDIHLYESVLTTNTPFEPVVLSGTDNTPSANNHSLPDENGASAEETLSASDRPPYRELHLPSSQNQYIPLKLFHWHLSADTGNQDSADRLRALLADIEKHLTAASLTPDIFAFTGTHTITGKGKERQQEYVETLCRTLWKHHYQKEPDASACRMIKTDPKQHLLKKHNIFWTEHMLIISMLPSKPFALSNFTAHESCSLDYKGLHPYASFLFLDVQYGPYVFPFLFFSSLDESIKDLMVPTISWQDCCYDLKTAIDLSLGKTEAMAIISHVNTPSFTYQDFAEQWSAILRKTEGKTKELSLKNPLAEPFFQRVQDFVPTARRFSAVLSYRRSLGDMKQPPRAHMAPDIIYLEFPGTRQKFLKWQGYSPFYPSYTEIQLDKNHISRIW